MSSAGCSNQRTIEMNKEKANKNNRESSRLAYAMNDSVEEKKKGKILEV